MFQGLKPYHRIKDSPFSWLRNVPAHWEVVRAKYVFKEIDERSLAGEEVHLSMSQKYGLVESSKVEDKSLQSENYAGGKLCKKDDLVLNRLKAHLGVFAHASIDGVVSPDYTVLRLIQDGEVRYFEFLFKTPQYITELRRSTKGIVEGFWRLYTEDFNNIRVIVPPLSEQRIILDWIDKFDHYLGKYIANKRKLIQFLKELKQKIIHQGITAGLNPDLPLKPNGTEVLTDIPDYWERIKLKFVAESIVGGSTPPSDRADCWDGNIVWVTPVDVSRSEALADSARHITQIGFDACSTVLVPPESIIITSRAPVGNVAISKVPLCTNQGCKAIVAKKDRLDAKFGFYLLRILQPELQRLSSGTTFMEISTFSLANIKILLPSITEQHNVVERIDSSLELTNQAVEIIKESIKAIRDYRNRVISATVTGQFEITKMEVPDNEDLSKLKTVDTVSADTVLHHEPEFQNGVDSDAND